jgi:hypothetical protein
MAKLSELNLSKDVIKHEVKDLSELPAQMGSRPPMLQPGSYVFQLPSTNNMREAFDNDKDGNLVVVFRDAAALTVVQAPPENAGNIGRPHGNRVSARARKRGKKDDLNAKSASDFDYLLFALGEQALPKTQPLYGEVLLKHGGEWFGADVELSWNCNDQKPIRVEGDGGQLVEMNGEEGRDRIVGCGARYYEKDVDKNQEGKYDARLSCTCGATLFANENLVRYRRVSQKPAPTA